MNQNHTQKTLYIWITVLTTIFAGCNKSRYIGKMTNSHELFPIKTASISDTPLPPGGDQNGNQNGVPVNAPKGIEFVDNDGEKGYIEGIFTVFTADDETNIDSYSLYFGSDSNTIIPLKYDAFCSISKGNSNFLYQCSIGGPLPNKATHILVRSANQVGEMKTGPSVLIYDRAVPMNAPTRIEFKNTSTENDEIEGNVTIGKASDETDVTDYVLYWANESTIQSDTSLITTIPKTGSDLTYTFTAGTKIPAGATHLLARTKNNDGNMPTGVYATVEKVKENNTAVPKNTALSIKFADTDPKGSLLDGIVTITRANSENDITHYVLYWGSSETDILTGVEPIVALEKNASNPTYTFINQSVPAKATHLLIRTKNDIGQMATGPYLLLVDLGVPLNTARDLSFEDTNDKGKLLDGSINVTVAAVETDILQYVLYWGVNETTILAGTSPIVTLDKTGSDLTYELPAKTSIPSGATHLLVRTKNSEGEMATGRGLLIIDKGVPLHPALSVDFSDTDIRAGFLEGSISITKATSEKDITSYTLYWGIDTMTILPDVPKIASLPKTGNNLVYSLAANTSKPLAATRILVRSQNIEGEMATGTSVLIIDRGTPISAATSVAFTDTDAIANQLGGNVTIAKAVSETDFTHYVLYWASSSTIPLSNYPAIVTLQKSGTNLTYTFPSETTQPTAATDLLVRTKNDSGEMATGTSILIKDKTTP